MSSMKQETKNVLVRIAGLTCVGLVGIMVIGCGLALSFGNYQLSTILFFSVTATLVAIKLVVKMME